MTSVRSDKCQRTESLTGRILDVGWHSLVDWWRCLYLPNPLCCGSLIRSQTTFTLHRNPYYFWMVCSVQRFQNRCGYFQNILNRTVTFRGLYCVWDYATRCFLSEHEYFSFFDTITPSQLLCLECFLFEKGTVARTVFLKCDIVINSKRIPANRTLFGNKYRASRLVSSATASTPDPGGNRFQCTYADNKMTSFS